jgi:MFS family permease
MRWWALLRRNPAFVRLWVAECVSLIGDWFSVVAISVLAAQRGGGEGALAVATTLAAYELPMAAVRPVAGVLADRFDRRSLLIVVHLVQAVCTAWMAERALVNDLVGLQALVFARSTVSGLDWPARNGALRRLVSDEDRLAANALGGASWSAMFAVGMALGGFVTTLGVPLALALDAVTFVGAAVLLTTLPAMPTRGATTEGPPGEPGRGNDGDDDGVRGALAQARADFVQGLAIALSSVDRFRAVASKTPYALLGGAGVVLLNLLAQRSAFAGSAALTLGVLQATRGLGTGIGPLLVARAVERGLALRRAWAVTSVLGVAGIAALGVGDGGWWCLLPVWLWGMGSGSNWMIASAELQRHADDAAIGRLSGLDLLAVEVSFACSALAGGWAVEATGRIGSAAAVGLVLGGCGWAALALGLRHVARRQAPAGGSRALERTT